MSLNILDRKINVQYLNHNEQPIRVILSIRVKNNEHINLKFIIDGVTVGRFIVIDEGYVFILETYIPNGATYMLEGDSDNTIVEVWEETKAWIEIAKSKVVYTNTVECGSDIILSNTSTGSSRILKNLNKIETEDGNSYA